MTKLHLKFYNNRFSDDVLNKSVSDLLEKNTLMSIATIKETHSYINTAYYAYNDKLDFFFLSPPDSQHCINLEKNPSTALSIYDSRQDWKSKKQGLQLLGTSRQVNARELLEAGTLYARRFVGLREILPNIGDLTKVMDSRFYKVEIEKFQIFDEENLEEDLFLLIEKFSKE